MVVSLVVVVPVVPVVLPVVLDVLPDVLPDVLDVLPDVLVVLPDTLSSVPDELCPLVPVAVTVLVVPLELTVSIPAVVLSELIRTVQTIRRMTGQRQPVNQGSVIAAALEMAFEEFRTKGATSQLVDKLRIE